MPATPLQVPAKYSFVFKSEGNRVFQLVHAADRVDVDSLPDYKDGRVSGKIAVLNGRRVLISPHRYAVMPSEISDLLVVKPDGLKWDKGITSTSVDQEARQRFVESCTDIRLHREKRKPNGDLIQPGLRPPQVGAVHACLGHWMMSNDIATVVMPTGTGKTDTMITLMCHEAPKRLLVVVPNDALRSQISDSFGHLGVLKRCGVVPERCPFPVIAVMKHRCKSQQAIDTLFTSANAVVTTVPLLAGQTDDELTRIASHCSHLFIDEAHHVKAPSWKRLRERLAALTIVQFTATPFRNDGQHIDGRVVFDYPLLRAQNDGYFRSIDLVEVWDAVNPDEAIAKAAVERLRTDLAGSFDHVLMARTRTIERAEAVIPFYEALASDLHPVVVHSNLPTTALADRLDMLKSRQSRVVITVAMFGEGFDFPQLKVAALHDIHQSLAVTIQFTGRFTRTSSNVGNATVVVNMADERVDDSVRELYAQGSDWNLVLRRLSEGANADQQRKEEFFSTFVKSAGVLPIQNVTPKMSARVFATTAADWKPWKVKDIFPAELLVGDVSISLAERVAYFVVASEQPVEFALTEDLRNYSYDLYALYWNSDHRLLFVNSSDMDSDFDGLARAVLGENVTLVKGAQVFRVLAGIRRLLFRNLGLSDRIRRSVRFTMLTGADVESGFSGQGAGRERTHIFADGFDGTSHITIGCSKKGRIWSWQVANDVLAWKEWCNAAAAKLTDATIDPDDYLKESMVPEDLNQRPQLFPIAIDWPDVIYERFEDRVSIESDTSAVSLFEVELELHEPSESGPLRFNVAMDAQKVGYRITFQETGVEYVPETSDFDIRLGRSRQKLSAFFSKSHPIIRYEQDVVSIGDQLLRPRQRKEYAFSKSALITEDWTGIDLTKESQGLARATDSIQFKAIQRMLAGAWGNTYSIIFDDDASGEAADVVGLSTGDGVLNVDLVHCKYSKREPGERIKDLYEVCGQAQKSIRWREHYTRLLDHLQNREAQRQRKHNATRYERGDAKALRGIILQARLLRPRFRVIIVQPGVTRADITPSQLEVLGATELFLRETFDIPLVVVCSE